MAMERVPRMVSVAREIFSQVRTSIVMKMRFLDMAVFRLKPVPVPVSFATDGNFLYYDPARLLKRYRAESNRVNRDYMHVLLHCIFRHPFVSTLVVYLSSEKWATRPAKNGPIGARKRAGCQKSPFFSVKPSVNPRSNPYVPG